LFKAQCRRMGRDYIASKCEFRLSDAFSSELGTHSPVEETRGKNMNRSVVRIQTCLEVQTRTS